MSQDSSKIRVKFYKIEIFKSCTLPLLVSNSSFDSKENNFNKKNKKCKNLKKTLVILIFLFLLIGIIVGVVFILS